MKNDYSIQRSIELTNLSESFLKYKQIFISNMKNSEPLCPRDELLNYFNASIVDWNDFHWQLKNRITKSEQLYDLIHITKEQKDEIDCVMKKYRWAITPYYLSQIRECSTNDPIFLQSIPQIKELENIGFEDPMNEKNNNPAGAITRRYPDRVILNITNCCASFCRHCQRRRNIGECDNHISNDILQESIDYIKHHPEIRDVLITGGDPLTLEDAFLDRLLNDIKNISSVEIIRIGSRTLVTLPQRITPNLINILKKYSPIYINTQFNHPYEITPETSSACELLADHGFVLGNQMVFLKGINNNSNILQLLNQLLLKHRVRPYYIFHPKEVIGTKHFSITIEEGIKIYKKLRGFTSGLAIPAYVINAPNGMGKIPLNSQLLELYNQKGQNILKTWEGKDIILDLS